jgi:hypothetical protein
VVLPDSGLLALHACARVAHMSGAAEYFNDLDWDSESDGEETSILTEDN